MKNFFVTAGAVATGTIFGLGIQVFLPRWLSSSIAVGAVLFWSLSALNTAWRKRLELQKKP